MPKVMIDSCVWINYFRHGEAVVGDAVDMLIDANQVVICGVIEAEIIQGIKSKRESLVQQLFQALDYVDCAREDFVLAGECVNNLRQKGITISVTDSIIASLCKRHHLELFTLDQDFKHVPKLKLYNLNTH